MKDRISKYNINVEYEGNVVLYNGLTGKLTVNSKEDYDIIQSLLNDLDSFSVEYPKLYSEYKKAGFIINEEFDEYAFIKGQNTRKVYMDRDYRLTINPTLDCNLKCWYCSVDYAGTKCPREKMCDETFEKLTKHVCNLIRSHMADSIVLDWFGGEPLMYYEDIIKPLSEHIFDQFPEINIPFRQQITTNATYLTKERIYEMKGYKFNLFQITIDGNREHHNKIKFYSNRSGTYDDIIANVNLIANIIPDVVLILRVNYDKQTLTHICDVINDLSEQAKRIVKVDFQRVWQVQMSDEDKCMLEVCRTKFKEAGIECTYSAFRNNHFIHCYADSIYHYVVNYDGKIFKCTARDYNDDISLGKLDINGNIEWNDNVLNNYFLKRTFENGRCEQCKYLPFCMGPCIQKNYEARIENRMVSCLLKDIDTNVNSWIINLAKKYNLL